jgi:hypothetical protein
MDCTKPLFIRDFPRTRDRGSAMVGVFKRVDADPQRLKVLRKQAFELRKQ